MVVQPPLSPPHPSGSRRSPPLQSPTVISARDLTKRYRDLTAVDGINFAIQQGECFGFLGPNGAGKTSTMKMISCVSPVTAGELLVQGWDVTRDQRAIKSALGVVSQADSLDSGLNVLQNLLSYGRYFNIDGEGGSKAGVGGAGAVPAS